MNRTQIESKRKSFYFFIFEKYSFIFCHKFSLSFCDFVIGNENMKWKKSEPSRWYIRRRCFHSAFVRQNEPKRKKKKINFIHSYFSSPFSSMIILQILVHRFISLLSTYKTNNNKRKKTEKKSSNLLCKRSKERQKKVRATHAIPNSISNENKNEVMRGENKNNAETK